MIILSQTTILQVLCLNSPVFACILMHGALFPLKCFHMALFPTARVFMKTQDMWGALKSNKRMVTVLEATSELCFKKMFESFQRNFGVLIYSDESIIVYLLPKANKKNSM